MKVETPIFSGPLDLLLSLIERRQIDICEVSIAGIADDYLEYVSNQEWLDIDQAAQFLVIAATLLYIKVRALLPQDEPDIELTLDGEDEVDPGQELVARLIEYRRFRDAALALRPLEAMGGRMFTRPERPLPKPSPSAQPLIGVDVNDLARAYAQVVSSLAQEFSHAPKDEIAIAQQMVAILSKLARRGRIRFHDMLPDGGSRSLVVATLLALLELVRRGRVKANQPAPFGDIWILQAGDEDEPSTRTGSD